jgi:alpha-tubulin suppressor-like RCC1 family protein
MTIQPTDPMTLPTRLAASCRRLLAAVATAGLFSGCIDVVSPFEGRSITTPTPVLSNASFAQVASGFFHTCALTAAGNAFCWGSNQWGQLGTNSVLPACTLGSCAFVPVTAGDQRLYSAIATGATHTCGLGTDRQTYCWGGTTVPASPILGDGATISSNAPIRVRTDSTFTQVTVGGAHACGLTAGGGVLCWGRNDTGQIGDSSTVNRGTPVPVATRVRFSRVSAGADFTCGLATAGAIFCWGSNQFGQLGTGEVSFNVPRTTLVPTVVSGGGSWTALASGGSHACALAATGRISCWGRNDDNNQLGDSTFVSHRGVPGAVKTSLTFVSVSAGAGTTCARTTSGEGWCWGGNAFGAVGNGRIANAGEPVPAKVLAGPYTQITPGGSHSCGIETTGRSKCWGDSFYGALGIR